MSKKSRLLKQGDVIELKDGHRVYGHAPKHFLYDNCSGDFELCSGEFTIGGELHYFSGKYIVIKTEITGGGYGHGPHDVYPDGHKVTCVKADNESVKVSFFQSGSFTCMIKDIEPVGVARLKWTL